MKANNTEFCFRTGQLLLVDKPLTWTSFDVVNKLRYAITRKVGKLKVGHAGTLDPLATGLLIIATGKFTKQLNQLQGLGKTYTGTLKLGASTPSYDAETEEDHHYPIDHISKELVLEKMKGFLGEQEQYPPVYSAIKVKGVPMYVKARKGQAVEVKSRQVSIEEFSFTDMSGDEVSFRVKCSKGTYIRSLIHDLGKGLDSGAYLTSLCRTEIGEYKLENAWKLGNLLQVINSLDEEVQPN